MVSPPSDQILLAIKWYRRVRMKTAKLQVAAAYEVYSGELAILVNSKLMLRNISDFLTCMNETRYLVLITKKLSAETMPTRAS